MYLKIISFDTMTEHQITNVAVVSKLLQCINFTIIKNSENKNKNNTRVRDYVLKYLAKRDAIRKRKPLAQRQQG